MERAKAGVPTRKAFSQRMLEYGAIDGEFVVEEDVEEPP